MGWHFPWVRVAHQWDGVPYLWGLTLVDGQWRVASGGESKGLVPREIQSAPIILFQSQRSNKHCPVTHQSRVLLERLARLVHDAVTRAAPTT